MILTRELARQFSEVVTIHPHAPFQSRYSEGEMTKIRRKGRIEDRSEKEDVVYGAGEDAERGGNLQKRVERADV